ncbi:hypothetical protein Bbelb_036450 [Branchiostoma belcheri]|nr:hypothetical protein Bbelb_036450 [Branchiostoma belcheri]
MVLRALGSDIDERAGFSPVFRGRCYACATYGHSQKYRPYRRGALRGRRGRDGLLNLIPDTTLGDSQSDKRWCKDEQPGMSQTTSITCLCGSMLPPHQPRSKLQTRVASKSNYYRLSFFPRTIKEWNELEPGVAEEGSLAQFKTGLARTLLH